MKRKFVLAGISGMLTIGLIGLVSFVDVEPIGPEGTCIGLSTLNQAVFDAFGANMLWYDITNWLGYAAILAAFLFGAMGFIQMIRRRSILKVDREILLLGCLYLAVIGLYILFENVIVNYRPVIMPGSSASEASFPSSHTMLVCVVMGSTMILAGRYIKSKPLLRLLRLACTLITGLAVIGRMLSGTHWFTDIVGGVLISITFLAAFSGMIGTE